MEYSCTIPYPSNKCGSFLKLCLNSNDKMWNNDIKCNHTFSLLLEQEMYNFLIIPVIVTINKHILGQFFVR